MFFTPFTGIIYGASNSGKTTFLSNFIANSEKLLFDDAHMPIGFDLIIIIFRSMHSILEKMKSIKTGCQVLLYKDSLVPDVEGESEKQLADRSEQKLYNILSSYPHARCPLLVFDDALSMPRLMYFIGEVFTRISHHKGLNCFFITQALFDQNSKRSSFLRLINRNSKIIVLFRNPRESRTVSNLIHQAYPNLEANQLLKKVRDAQQKPYSYLVFDFDQRTPEFLRIKGNIFSENPPHFPFCIATNNTLPKTLGEKNYDKDQAEYDTTEERGTIIQIPPE